MSRTPSMETLSKLSTSIRKLSSIPTWKSSRNNMKKQCAFSDTESFLLPEDAGKLSLEDISLIFLYMANVNRTGFDRQEFLACASADCLTAIIAMDVVTSMARGDGVHVSLVEDNHNGDNNGNNNSNRYEDVDALYLLAALRIFTEWRSNKCVPPGYKRYAMSISLAYHDMLKNLQKIETSIHAWFEDNAHLDLRSPTIRQVLEREIDLNMHSCLPNVKEVSAASGFLWAKRQMEYYIATWCKSIQVDEDSSQSETLKAVLSAYEEVYDRYHGWALQQVFRHALKGCPEIGVMLKNIVPTKPKQPALVLPRASSSMSSFAAATAPLASYHHYSRFNSEDNIIVEEESSRSNDLMTMTTATATKIHRIDGDNSDNENNYHDPIKTDHRLQQQQQQQQQQQLDTLSKRNDNHHHQVFLLFVQNFGTEFQNFGKEVGREWEKVITFVKRFDCKNGGADAVNNNNNFVGADDADLSPFCPDINHFRIAWEGGSSQLPALLSMSNNDGDSSFYSEEVYDDEMEEEIIYQRKEEGDADDNNISIRDDDKSKHNAVVIAREVVDVAVGGHIMDEGKLMRANVAAHVRIMKSLLEGLHDLIEDLNMNDPKRV